MEGVCLRHTELPSTTRLFSDFLYQYHRVERFYTAPPSTGYPEDRRSALVEALRQQNPSSPSVDLIAQPGAVAVVTGQQVGLFSGPAYTIYKALTAAKTARDLTEAGRPAVPVFWLATEDHDFAEVNHVWVANVHNQPVKLSLGDLDSGLKPVGNVTIDRWPVEGLRSALAEFPFAEQVCELAEQSYTPGATMGEAFQALLEKILKPYGFLFLDPLHTSIRELAAPFLREAVERRSELHEALLQRNRELETAGYHAQVHVDSRTSLFFLLEEGRRVPVRDVRYSVDQLASRAAQLSPNALLRPVVQDYLLPTAAYIGGPAEVAYFAQSQTLYEKLLGHMPRVISRSGFTLLDGRTAKLLNRYQLKMPHFFNGEESLREQIASQLVPPSLQQEFEAAERSTGDLLDHLRSSVQAFDPTLASALDKSRAKISHQLTKSRAKIARETLRRDQRARAEAEYLYGGIYPHKHLQERFYSILPFLAKYGVDLIDRLYENVRLECPDHILLPV